jgi:UDP-GlcNAc3NAcA epimerase
MKILTIVGARPQFVKAAPVSTALREAGLEQIIVHTGQHYDFAMSELFFQQLQIPPPAKFLNLGGGSHGKMTGDMLGAVEALLLEDRPGAVMVYGDTNSTIAGALAAAKLHIPVIHVEAGLRSRNKRMPEEINRILTDHVSDLLFCSSQEGVTNLAAEGIHKGVHICGDVMADAALHVRGLLEDSAFAAKVGAGLPILPPVYDLLTLHRAENTDDRARMASVLDGLGKSNTPILFPAHPRTGKMLAAYNLELPKNIILLEPVGYFEMCLLLQRCRKALTDSGGLQKEALWFGKPCVTLRDETEWVETLFGGWNHLVGADSQKIAQSRLVGAPDTPCPFLYGDGKAAEKIAQGILRHFN